MARILIVDDEPGYRETIGIFLKKEGYDCEEASDGFLAWEKIQQQDFDLVITDIIMPKSTGVDLLEKINATYPDIKVIMITGEPSLDTATRALRSSAFDYISKPIKRNDLIKTVNSALKIKKLEDELDLHHNHLEALVEDRTKELEIYRDRLEHIAENTREFVNCKHIEELAPRALELFSKNMGADGGSFYLHHSAELVLVSALDPGHQIERIPLPISDDTPLGRVLSSKKPLIINDIKKDDIIKSSGWDGYKNGTLLIVPCLSSDGSVIAVVTLHNKKRPPFGSRDIELSRIMASHTIESIRGIELYKQLKNSEEKFRALAEFSEDAIMRFDKDYRHSYVNPAVETFTGISRESFINRTHREIGFSEELCKSWENAIEAVFKTNKSRHEMFQLPDGKWIDWLLVPEQTDKDGAPQSVITSARDISRIMDAEHNLRRMAAAIHNATEDVIITDLQGKIEYVNPAFTSVTGYEADEVIGQTPRILKSGIHPDAFYDELWATITAGEIWKGQITNRTKDGSLVSEDAVISPIRDDNGRVSGYVATRRDITEQKEIEKRLSQAQKMESLGTLAGGIAHDFNNILGTIIGNVELTLMDIEESNKEQANENLKMVLSASSRAADLAKQILIFSRRETRERRPVMVHLIIKEAAQLLRSTLSSTVEIEQFIYSKKLQVLADPIEIHQIIMNLCTNSAHALEGKGGKIKIMLTDDVQKTSSAGAEAETICKLSIIDNGEGIPEHVLPNIFDPFFTTKPKGKGTGLGLSVVHGIVQSLGGEICVESKPQQGTTFEITLPTVKADEFLGESDDYALPSGHESVLFVDDEEGIRIFVEKILTRLGYSVTTKKNGEEALAVLLEQPGAFNLVMTDLNMPKVSGMQLVGRIRKEGYRLPIILTTGSVSEDLEKMAENSGVGQIIRKPFDAGTLSRAIRLSLDEFGHSN